MTGRGIPQLYVVRADGKQIYGGAGSLSGDDLPAMLLASLKQAGRSFSNQDAILLHDLVATAEQALNHGDLLKSAMSLSEVARFGSLENLGSYARPALRASELYTELKAKVDERILDAKTKLQDDSVTKPLELMLTIHESEAIYKQFTAWASQASSTTRELAKESIFPSEASQAEALVRARVIAASSSPRVRKRAESAYTTVIRRFPGTAADTIARRELAEIAPDAKVLTIDSAATPVPSMQTPAWRTWKTMDGEFQTRARLIEIIADKVRLMKPDGATIVVDIKILSESDRNYIASQSE